MRAPLDFGLYDNSFRIYSAGFPSLRIDPKEYRGVFDNYGKISHIPDGGCRVMITLIKHKKFAVNEYHKIIKDARKLCIPLWAIIGLLSNVIGKSNCLKGVIHCKLHQS